MRKRIARHPGDGRSEGKTHAAGGPAARPPGDAISVSPAASAEGRSSTAWQQEPQQAEPDAFYAGRDYAEQQLAWACPCAQCREARSLCDSLGVITGTSATSSAGGGSSLPPAVRLPHGGVEPPPEGEAPQPARRVRWLDQQEGHEEVLPQSEAHAVEHRGDDRGKCVEFFF